MDGQLDSEQVRRVLGRAHDIEAASNGPEHDAGVSAQALIEAASEVGIDPDAVRDSLAIERLTVGREPPGRLDRLAGPSSVVVEREIEQTLPAASAAIDEWLTTGHRMRCDRRADGLLHAQRRADSSANIGRFVAGLRGDARLGRVRSLVVEAVPLNTGATPSRPRTLVRIEAEREVPRQLRLGGGAVVATAGIGSGAVLAAETFAAFPAVALPSMVVGYFVARSGRGHADRLELELERLLSAVERNERPTRLLGRTARRATRAIARRSRGN